MSKVAAIQMCSSNIVDDNLKTALLLMRQAVDHGAKLVVLPEMFAIFSSKSNDKVLAKEQCGHGKIQDFLAKTAAQLGIWIVGGTIPIETTNKNKVRAASLVYDSNGENVARYDKIHLFDVVLSDAETYKESDTTEPGNQLTVIETPFGKLGLSVCYDIRFPGLFTHLLNAGAEIISIPSAFTVKTGAAHWELLTRSRAVENFCYVIGACQGGTHLSGRQTYGHTLIVEPWGNIVQEIIEPGNGIIYAEIDLQEQKRIRASIPVIEHQKIYPDTSRLLKTTNCIQVIK